MKAAKKKLFLSIGIILFLAFFAGGCKQKQIEPNVVLIVVDTLRADHLPFYRYKKNTAPFLEKLSSQNIVFENAFSASSWTAPATASIFTSLYPFQHGVVMGLISSRRNEIKLNRIPEEAKTLAEVLGENGYTAYCVAENININEEMGFAQGFDKFKRFRYSRSMINQQLEDWSGEMKAKKKYFLYIHYNDPHWPYHPRSPWYKKKEDPKTDLVARYDSEINYVDEKIKKMYGLFGWDRNTVLIITSDHGEGFWEHDSKGHGITLYSEVIHIPLIIQFPKTDKLKKRMSVNVSNLDILPTIMGYLDIKSMGSEVGVDLMPLIRGECEYNPERHIFSHLDRVKKEKEDLKFISVISEEWKLIFRMSGAWELYNLKDDPSEKLNVYDENSEIARLLLSEFLEFEKNCKKLGQKKVEITLDKKKIEELKALGYVK